MFEKYTRRIQKKNVPEVIGDKDFYWAQKFAASTSAITEVVDLETKDPLMLNVYTPHTANVYFSTFKITGLTRFGGKILLYDLPYMMPFSNTKKSQDYSSLPIPPFFSKLQIQYATTPYVNINMELLPISNFFGSHTGIIDRYENTNISAMSSSDVQLYVPPFAKFINVACRITGAYNKDVEILIEQVLNSEYDTLESVLGVTDLNFHFEYVTIPSNRAWNASGDLYERFIRVRVTNNDASNNIVRTHLSFQYLF